ncbi:MAG TPA: DUF4352 domain-containing protein [Ktedonobacteraceae bacterium]|nr:DUF4352 domain-containing protein [Ktedonobacteraceae bacterium]
MADTQQQSSQAGYGDAKQAQSSPQQPFYPQQSPKQKSRKRLWLIVGIVLAIIVIGAAASQAGKSGTSSSNSTGSTSTQSSSNTIGKPVVVDDTWTVTVNKVTTSHGNNFSSPKGNNIYLVVDVTVKNTSSSDQMVSSAGMFTLKDSTGQPYTETVTTFTKPPDGTVTPGSVLRGQLVYEVPASEHTFTFGFQADITGTDLTEWTLSI